MHNQNEEFFMTKKKKPSFAEWTMQNGINLNQTTPKPLTLGEVAPKATERVTSSASTTTKPQTRDPFLEGFYSTDDKPETERKTYLQHRTPAVDRVSPETKKPEPIKLPYRPSVQGPPKVTKLPYVPQKDGTPKMTQYKNDSAKPYGSPVKIVGDNVTEKDYEDFWNAFRNEGTGDKLNWVANKIKLQSTSDVLKTKTHSPQTDALIDELRDIEAMEQGDKNSEWYRRLEAAWDSGSPEEYRKTEQAFQAQKTKVYEGLGLRDYETAYKDARKENSPIPIDFIEAISLPDAEYPYWKRLWDNYIVDPQSTEGLQNMDRARKTIDDIPDFTKASVKGLSKFGKEAVKSARFISDAHELYNGISRDLKDDGKLGWDSARAIAKVGAGNVGGMIGAPLGAAYGMAVGGPAGALAGGVLGNVYASTDWESRIDAGFDYLKDRKKIKEYLND